MTADEKYFNQLLHSWEETYKKGQLTFWLLLSLRDRPQYVGEIRDFIEHISDGTIRCEEQSLYRSLRKFLDLDIVSFETREGNRGPDRKYYSLTRLGKKLLTSFIERNIFVFYRKELESMIKEQGV